jgi:hypothetical protein
LVNGAVQLVNGSGQAVRATRVPASLFVTGSGGARLS